MNTIAQTADSGPWYRQPWPWLLMAGPAIVIVAGSLTMAFAIETFDGLVADDYYKQGTAINATLRRDEAAVKMGYVAELAVDTRAGHIEMTFRNAAPSAAELKLTLSPAARPGQDRIIVLTRLADRHYAAALPRLEPELWRLNLDDSSGQWRLTGQWRGGDSKTVLGSGANP